MLDKVADKTFNVEKVLTNRSVILTFITHEYCDMLLNWYKHLEKLEINNFVLVVCLDEEAFSYIVKKEIPCLYVDQDKLINNESIVDITLLKKAYIEKHHICKAFYIGYITTKYNINVLHSDIDMIFLKSPLDRLEQIANKKYDMCAYMDLSYQELTTGKPREGETGGFGFVIFYVTPGWYPKFLKKLSIDPLCIDNNDVGQTVMQKHFSEIECHWLNSFLFTNYDIWKEKHVQQKIKNLCYCIHYNTSENTWMYKMTADKIGKRNNLKIERMRENGHWLL